MGIDIFDQCFASVLDKSNFILVILALHRRKRGPQIFPKSKISAYRLVRRGLLEILAVVIVRISDRDFAIAFDDFVEHFLVDFRRNDVVHSSLLIKLSFAFLLITFGYPLVTSLTAKTMPWIWGWKCQHQPLDI